MSLPLNTEAGKPRKCKGPKEKGGACGDGGKSGVEAPDSVQKKKAYLNLNKKLQNYPKQISSLFALAESDRRVKL